MANAFRYGLKDVVFREASNFMIWSNAFLDFVDDLCRLICIFSFKVVLLGFRSFVDHELMTVSQNLLTDSAGVLNHIGHSSHTLKFVGCRRVTLQPTMLLK